MICFSLKSLSEIRSLNLHKQNIFGNVSFYMNQIYILRAEMLPS